MPVVTFGDCLTSILSPVRSRKRKIDNNFSIYLGQNQSPVLPLVRLNYHLLSENTCQSRLSPNLLFQSITRHSAAEKTDMENLEILGDCFLKLAMSMSLYHKYPSDGSGKLTSEKDRQVSNKNLRRLVMEKELQNYLYNNEIKYGGKEANWMPPGYTTVEENSERYLKQKAKRKAFADMSEALIGAFLISTDYMTTIKFMAWLGLDVIPIDEHKQIMTTPSILSTGLSDAMNEVNHGIKQFFIDQNFAEIEEKIKYNFHNKAYLIAAFTHPSYYNNRLTQCYERYCKELNDRFCYILFS
jgi:endoribonuclease Dicer